MSEAWPIMKIGELCEVVTKGTTPTSVGHLFVSEGINFVKVESIATDGSFLPQKFGHITEACHVEFRRSQLADGDILFSIAGALGRTALVTAEILPANTNQALAIVRLKKEAPISREFLVLALGTGVLLEQIEKSKGGVAQLNLSLAQVRDFLIPVPPLAEQQRIVGILDEAFAGIATAKANAEKNLQNARALFESHLQSVFTHRGKDWVEKPIAECFKVRSGDFLPAKAMVESGEFNVFGGNGINGRHDKKNLSGENIIIGRVGAKCGNVHYVEGDAWVTDNALYISDFLHSFDRKFLTRLLRFKDLRSRANQMAQPVISFTTIKDVKLEFPTSKAEQEEIVHLSDGLEEETQRLAAIYERKLAALEALKKSLLHQAFSGAL